MNKTVTLWAAIVLIVIGLAGMAATMAYRQPAGIPVGMMRADVDALFIEEMVPHHDDAIAMAELAITRAEHPEIKQLAEKIKRTQSAENAQMREWYREWFDAEVPEKSGSNMMDRMMGSGMDLDDLKVAEPFDKAFIEAMIPHHQMGIMMSQMADSTTDRTELRRLTRSIIEAQSAEIDEMREWYDEWYGN
jgi:uncharacterized protein (DUF305 family)